MSNATDAPESPRRPRWLTRREQLLLAFVLAILAVGGIVSHVRNPRPAAAAAPLPH